MVDTDDFPGVILLITLLSCAVVGMFIFNAGVLFDEEPLTIYQWVLAPFNQGILASFAYFIFAGFAGYIIFAIIERITDYSTVIVANSAAIVLIISGVFFTDFSIDQSRDEFSSRNSTLIPLTVTAVPSDARIRIMNIKPVYEDGILLAPGKYNIKIDSPGFATYNKWLHIKAGADEVYVRTVLDRNTPEQDITQEADTAKTNETSSTIAKVETQDNQQHQQLDAVDDFYNNYFKHCASQSISELPLLQFYWKSEIDMIDDRIHYKSDGELVGSAKYYEITGSFSLPNEDDISIIKDGITVCNIKMDSEVPDTMNRAIVMLDLNYGIAAHYSWYESGQIRSKEIINNGKQHRWITWHEDGRIEVYE